MLSKKNKLTGFEVSEIIKAGSKAIDPWFTCYWQKSPDKTFKASVVVAKRLKLSSVQRHCVKRRVYHMARQLAKNTQTALRLVRVVTNKKFVNGDFIVLYDKLKTKWQTIST